MTLDDRLREALEAQRERILNDSTLIIMDEVTVPGMAAMYSATSTVRYPGPRDEIIGTIREALRPRGDGWVRQRFLDQTPGDMAVMPWSMPQTDIIGDIYRAAQDWDTHPRRRTIRPWKDVGTTPAQDLRLAEFMHRHDLTSETGRLTHEWAYYGTPPPPVPWRPHILTQEPTPPPATDHGVYLVESDPQQAARPDQRAPRRRPDRINIRIH